MIVKQCTKKLTGEKRFHIQIGCHSLVFLQSVYRLLLISKKITLLGGIVFVTIVSMGAVLRLGPEYFETRHRDRSCDPFSKRKGERTIAT